jgi:hypothetical protein
MARRADEVLSTPPPALSELGREELETLRRLLRAARAPSGQAGFSAR